MMQQRHMPNPTVQEDDVQSKYDAQKSSKAQGHSVTGIVSMENILEYILGSQIMDEKDTKNQSFFTRSIANKKRSLIRSYQRAGSIVDEKQMDDYFADEQENDEPESPAVFRTNALQGFFDQMQGKITDRVKQDVANRSASEMYALSAGTVPGQSKFKKTRTKNMGDLKEPLIQKNDE